MSFILSHALMDSPEARQTALLIHGALGAGQNLRSFAKRLQMLRPDYRCVLVDLRAHGGSADAPPPHTFEAAARDVAVLIESLGPELPTTAVIGHSLGGKLTLELCHQGLGHQGLGHQGLGGQGVPALKQAWILDSNPGAQPVHAGLEILKVLAAVKNVSMPALSRADVVNELRAQGLNSGIANWMTTNLKRVGEHYVWVFNLTAIEQLVDSYFAWDLWPFLEAPREAPEIHFVVADASDRIDSSMRQRLLALPSQSHCHVHVLPNSGHWVHVDNPEGLLELMASRLVR